jgi:DNA polymerase I-like protein with 3'-5' exonuclease and polymerase domains
VTEPAAPSSPAKNYGMILQVDKLKILADRLLESGRWVGFDVETGYLGPDTPGGALNHDWSGQFTCGFSISGDPAWARYIPLHHDMGGNIDHPDLAWEVMEPLLTKGKLVIHHRKMEQRAVEKDFGVFPAGGYTIGSDGGTVMDTMLLAYVLSEFKHPSGTRGAHGLKDLTEILFGHKQPHIQSLFPKATAKQLKALRFNQLDLSPEVVSYCCEDAAWALSLYFAYGDRALKQRGNMARIEHEIATLMSDVEKHGVAVDWDAMAHAHAQALTFEPSMEKSVKRALGELAEMDLADVSLNSPKQMQKLLYSDIGLSTTRMTKSAADKEGVAVWEKMSTDAIALEGLSKKHPAIRLLLDLRETGNLANRIEKWLRDYRLADDDRVHANYNQIQVGTGRFAANDPAIQQCLSGDTEVLTPAGWQRLDELADGVEVAQYHESGGIDFITPTQVIRQDHVGPMLDITMWGRTFRYTPDHRIVSRARRQKTWFADEARIVATWQSPDRLFPRAGHRIGGEVLTADLRDSLRLALVAQSDGHLNTAGKEPYYDVNLLRQRCQERLGDIPIVQKFYEESGRLRGKIPHSAVSAWLDGTSEKNLRPEKILALSEADLRFVVEEVKFWDGDWSRGASYSQSVAREDTLDLIQAAATLCGISTSTFEKHPDAIQLNLCERELRQARHIQATESCADRVYCVTVPTGMFVARRDGLVLITGNCPKEWRWSVVCGADAWKTDPDDKSKYPDWDPIVEAGKNGVDYWSGNFRDFIIAPPGSYLLTYDYSQIELRVLAGESQEPALLEAFNEDRDVHTLTAAMMLGKRPEDIDKKTERPIGKTMNFALLYGMGAKSLAERLGYTMDKAKELYASYFAAFSRIASWQDAVTARGMRLGYSETRFGRKYMVWELQSENKAVQAKGERVLTNAPIQGGAADYMKLAMIRVTRALKEKGWWMNGCTIVMNQHDSLSFEVSDDLDPAEVRAVLEAAVVFPVPGFPKIVADWELGQRWGSSTPWKAGLVPEFNGEHWVLVKGDPVEKPPALELTEQADLQEPVQEVSHRTWVETEHMPDRESFNELLSMVRERSGEEEVWFRCPNGEVKIGQGSITSADQGRISLLLGGAKVLQEKLVEDMSELTMGLSA